MTAFERCNSHCTNTSRQSELSVLLTETQLQIELIDENENTIERTLKLDSLLEQLDWLQSEIDAALTQRFSE